MIRANGLDLGALPAEALFEMRPAIFRMRAINHFAALSSDQRVPPEI